MRSTLVHVVCFIFLISNSICVCSIHSTFHHFDILKSEDISVKVVRSASNTSEKLTRISFRVFQTRFSSVLTLDTRVLRPDARVTMVDGNGSSQSFDIDRGSFFSGTINGNRSYVVDAATFGSTWIIHVQTPKEFYAVEPLSFYDSKANPTHMIAYRGRDIKSANRSDQKPSCGNIFLAQLLNRSSQDAYRKIVPQTVGSRKHFFAREDRKSQKGDTYRLPYWGNVLSKNKRRSHVHYPFRFWRKPDNRAQNQQKEPNLLNLQYNLGIQNTKIDAEHSKRKYASVLTSNSRRKRSVRSFTAAIGYTAKKARKFDESKRQRPVHCDILAIVDFSLFKGFGETSMSKIVVIMVHIYKIVDKIFRKTTFGGESSGYGIVLAGIRIHSEPSLTSYNAVNKGISPYDLIMHMTRHKDFHAYCAVHLNVQRDFGATIGLSTVPIVIHYKDGICSEDLGFAHNVLLSTVIDGTGYILSLRVST
ncbi:hypothetical protein RRG08_019856 [Elysia crispata]|uniref:Peptidase A1 domain-containing protein n=1 Tax=Elysia crispata TaxID=231223 RepID=A0AAE1AH43_9GAST|nr:hypothetical protein RRG08_019856 [Elysia crispata]